MRAYMLKQYGGPDGAELAEILPPVTGSRDIVVAVKAAGLNPLDYKFRQGKLKAITRPALPLILGHEFAGEVIAIGGDVQRFAVGDRVYARVGEERIGAFAEQIAIDESLAALMPHHLDYTEAAAIPLAGLTALQALRDELSVKKGQKVFISGGAGGVGTLAIQLAKWLGAHVTTTASPRGEALVRSLGCDEVIDYTQTDIAELDRSYDAGLDLVGGETLEAMFKIVKTGGKVVSVAGVPEPQTAQKDLGGRSFLAALFWLISLGVRGKARQAGVHYRYLFMHPSGEELAQLTALAVRGKLKPVVDKIYPFEEIAEAMAYLESGRAKGKVVVRFD